MKIGIIFPKDSEAIFDTTSLKTFGGATVQMFIIANELFKNKENNIFCLTPQIKNKKDIPLRIVEIFNIKKTILETVYLFHNKIKKEKPDVLIQHGLTIFSCLLSLYCRIFKIKFVFMFASDVEVEGIYQTSKKRCILFNLLLQTAEIIVVQNKYQNKFLSDKKGVKNSLIYMGFPIRTFLSAPRGFVLWIGRCDPWKQPQLFIDLAKVHKDQRFLMICPKVDAKFFNKIKTLAKEINNLTFIDFASFEDSWKYFEQAKLLINTSRSEGFPQTFIQSVICGVPIISLNVNPDNFISDNQCGFVCGGDTKLLNTTLLRVLEDSSVYNSLSNNSLIYANKNHDIAKNIINFMDILK